MFQAIVFLPLLGAIIAGLIALVGSYRRATTEPDFGHDTIGLDAVDAGASTSTSASAAIALAALCSPASFNISTGKIA